MADESRPAGAPDGHEPHQSAAFGPSTMTPGGRVPLRENVSSTSQMPTQVSPLAPVWIAAPLASRDQLFTLIEHQHEMIQCQRVTNESLHKELGLQRKIFTEERDLWLITTGSLEARITKLEAQLRRISGTSSATGDSSTNTASSEVEGNPSKLTGNDDGARRSSSSETASSGLTSDQTPVRATSEALSGGSVDAAVTTIGPGRISSLDESFKNAKNAAKESLLSKGKIGLPENADPTLKNAGHTPMARRSLIMTLDADGAATSSDTGIEGDLSEKIGEDHPPLDSKGKGQDTTTQPSERQGSYFGAEEASVDGSADDQQQVTRSDTTEDSPLEGPLGLTNSPDNERNKIFLGEINRKLSQVDLSEVAGNVDKSKLARGFWPRDSPSSQVKQMQNADGTTSEVPESDPVLRIKHNNRATFDEGEPEQPLRIKTSQNFGSALGQGEEVDYGKGFRGRQT